MSQPHSHPGYWDTCESCGHQTWTEPVELCLRSHKALEMVISLPLQELYADAAISRLKPILQDFKPSTKQTVTHQWIEEK